MLLQEFLQQVENIIIRNEREKVTFKMYFIMLFLYLSEVLPEMESQGEYEGQNFSFTSPDNMDNGGSQNLTKLTTANMEDMEEYYNFGKDTSSYTTP